MEIRLYISKHGLLYKSNEDALPEGIHPSLFVIDSVIHIDDIRLSALDYATRRGVDIYKDKLYFKNEHSIFFN